MTFRPTPAAPRAGAALLCVAGLCLPALLHAAPVCEPPQGRRILQVQPPQPGEAQDCDLMGLQKMPAREIVTALPTALGMKGQHRWKGVPLRHLAERMGGGEHSQIQLTALNDYAVQIPWSDLVRYDPILAYQRNGQPMGIRDKGPLILIYPFDGHPQLQAQEYLNRTIWQVDAISIR